jgi:hypothetical protein
MGQKARVVKVAFTVLGNIGPETVPRPKEKTVVNDSMKSIPFHFAGVLSLLLASTQAPLAVPITGNIGIDGALTFNSSSAGTATAVTSWIDPVVGAASGVFAVPSVFAVSPGTAVTMTPSFWNFNTSTPINNFWTVGGFTFQLLSSFIYQQGGTPGVNAYVVVDGTGLVSGNGYSPTPMTWNFTSQDPLASTSPNEWTFSASGASAAVPDTAATAGLLAAGWLGAVLMKRRQWQARGVGATR